MNGEAGQLPSFFSLGGVLRIWWRPPQTLAPWICAAVILAALALWDLVIGARRVDFILLGLAAYELMIGLTETDIGERVDQP